RRHRHSAARAVSRRRTGRHRQPSGALMLWLAVYLPLLPLEVFRDRSDQPTVVIDEQSRVLLRNDAAVTAGIAPGVTLATAHSIVPGLLHHRRSPERELARLRLLGDALYGLSSRVSLVPPASADA